MNRLKKAYEDYYEEARWEKPHGEDGECSRACGRDMDCPVMEYEEWLDYITVGELEIKEK